MEDALRELHALAESEYNSPWKLALREQAYQIARDMGGESEGSRLLVTHRWLGLLLRLGMTNRALDVFESIPIQLRERVLEHPGDLAEANGLPVSWDFADLRLEMAAALVLEDRRDLAKQLVIDAPPVIDGDASALLAILDLCMEPSATDPFGLFVDGLTTAIRDSSVESVTWRRLIASLAARESYPVLARYQNRTAARDLHHNVGLFGPDARVAEDSRADGGGEPCKARHRRSQVLPRTTGRGSRYNALRRYGGGNIRRLIAASGVAEFREQPLPDGIVPTPMSREEERAHRVELTRKHRLPYGHSIIRVERRERLLVALGASHDYDPVGGLSGGAYWVSRSHDGGARWDRPLYTGLRIMMPYVASHVSPLPMIGRSGIQLEVEVREGDPDAIFLPGGFARYKRKESGLFVELPWELLERDSDADGLTDLAEERLITDPKERDTDRDGLEDGFDTLPHVPHAVVKDDRVALLQTILEQHVRFHGDADVQKASERTVFVVGTRAHFRGVEPPRRTVGLSPQEHAAAEAKFGPIFATQIKLMIINRAGDMAFAVWSARWHGGAWPFEKVGTEWIQRGGWTWIS